jgi:hypothetical protein
MKDIQWSSPDDSSIKNPWDRPRHSTFRDLVLKEEYRSRRLRFEPGQTWLRVVPAFASSPFGWMLGVHTLTVPSACFAHPRTLKHNGKSIFDHAYAWLKENHPALLYSKANKSGVRLLPDPVCVFWALVEKQGQYVARLVQSSGYDGSRGGAPGLGHQILRLTQREDETGAPMAEPVHPERGVLIAVEKTRPHGAKYASYSLVLGRQPAPMAEILKRTAPEEFEVLRPLEEVIHQPSVEQEWEFLSSILPSKQFEEFRRSLGM